MPFLPEPGLGSAALSPATLILALLVFPFYLFYTARAAWSALRGKPVDPRARNDGSRC